MVDQSSVGQSVLIGIAMAMTCGCYGGGPEFAKVSGTVSFHGKPLTGGQITFIPAQGPSAFGTIESDGSFVLSTKRPGENSFSIELRE